MIKPVFYQYVLSALLGCIYQAHLSMAALQTPACSLNCTLLQTAECGARSLQDCLCTNNTLLFELSSCVYYQCNQTDQITASQVLQTEICVGVPFESRHTYIVAVEIIIAAITFSMVALRLMSRVLVAQKLWWDDWMIVVCAVFMVPNTAIPIYTTFIGFGEHLWNVPAVNIVRLNLLFWISTIFYALIQNIAKFSVLFLYLRIFPTPSFRMLVKIAMVWQACHLIAFLFVVIFECVPVQAVWELSLKGKCININATNKAGAFASIFEDFVIIVLPIGELQALNLGLKKRIALILMFALGSFASITSIIRLRYVWNYGFSVDGTWTHIDIVIWSDVETYVAVICSCLMCVRPLFVKMFPALFSSTQSHSSHTKSSSKNSLRKTWGMKIGSTMKLPNVMKFDSNGMQMSRLDDDDERPEESGGSARKIIIQGNNESERHLQGIELEERGYTPSTTGRSETVEITSVEGLGLHVPVETRK